MQMKLFVYVYCRYIEILFGTLRDQVAGILTNLSWKMSLTQPAKLDHDRNISFGEEDFIVLL